MPENKINMEKFVFKRKEIRIDPTKIGLFCYYVFSNGIEEVVKKFYSDGGSFPDGEDLVDKVNNEYAKGR